MDLSESRRKRLIALLKQSRAADLEFSQFGSKTHQYKMNPPLSAAQVRAVEEQYKFQLPVDYVWFLTVVGNGGAGPNYGLYPFGTHEQKEDFSLLNQPHILDPKNSPEVYEDFIAYYEEDCDEDEYDRRNDELWQGLLTIGTAGCTYDMMLVVSGKDRGRILHIDRDRQRPYFSPDASFLDWYERWLVETASGCQMHGFDSRIGGNAQELCNRYRDAVEVEKDAIVQAMSKFNTVAPAIVEQIYTYFKAEENPSRKGAWLSHLSWFGYAHTERLLREALTDQALCENALYALYRRFRSQKRVGGQLTDVWSPELDDWYADILSALPLAVALTPDAGGAFYSCVRMLNGSSRFQMEDMEPFFRLDNLAQRSSLFYMCEQKPMSHRFAELYFAWLLENCEVLNYHEIRNGLGECLTVAEHNEAEKDFLTEKLTALCLKLLKDFSHVPPDSKDPYIRNNVYQTLEKLGKNRAWLDRNR